VSLTGLGATVSNSPTGVNINATVGALGLTGLAASISNPSTINASVGALSLTGLQALINNTTAITANTGSLSLTGLQSAVVNTYAVSATVGQLNLVGLSATVTNAPSGININAGIGELSLIGLSAVINNGTAQTPTGGIDLFEAQRRNKRKSQEKLSSELTEQEAEIKALMQVALVKSKKTAKSRKSAEMLLKPLELPIERKTELVAPKVIIEGIIQSEVVLISDDDIEMMLALMMEMI
jgi:hypothetical protein